MQHKKNQNAATHSNENDEKIKRSITDFVEQTKSNVKLSASPQARPGIKDKKQCPICGKSFPSIKLEVSI